VFGVVGDDARWGLAKSMVMLRGLVRLCKRYRLTSVDFGGIHY
jgi:hypothetical protein